MTDADALTRARARLQAERERLRKTYAPRVRPPADARWLPTPSQGEADLTSARSVVANKAYDLSPIDPQSFDPTPGPPLAAFPVNTTPPAITPLDTLEVGHQLIGGAGAWTPAGMTYLRAWYRGDMLITGATGAAYTTTVEDVGAMIGLVVRAINSGGSASADAAPVGPIVPA